ncbi:MAG TPA: DUF4870 domain-containing protein [Anaerolineaceae bacterium]|nr:DUF4870 domain-containing protein [Anaerolineaceae bacterium]HPN50188.1 DUF4870 domain-containing protein [Anaerolineaceae bacterium]
MSQYVDPNITPDDKLWALLSYILTPLVPLIVILMEDKKNRPFIKAHAYQALVLGVANLIISTVLSFVFIGVCTAIAVFGLCIYWGIKAYQGEYITIPVITDFCKKQGWA